MTYDSISRLLLSQECFFSLQPGIKTAKLGLLAQTDQSFKANHTICFREFSQTNADQSILSSIGFSQYSLRYQILAFLFMGNYRELVTSAFWPQNSFWKAAGSPKNLGLILSKFHKLSKTQFICQGNGDNEVESIDTVMINLGQMLPPLPPAPLACYSTW